jgi:hypothetical protein
MLVKELSKLFTNDQKLVSFQASSVTSSGVDSSSFVLTISENCVQMTLFGKDVFRADDRNSTRYRVFI